MNILEAILNRFSTRAFLTQSVSRETITEILKHARYAPSGVNHQPWEVVVVTGTLQTQLGTAIITAREQGLKEAPDYDYYPRQWVEPYKSRRKACGAALYSAIQITLEETEKRKAAWYRNYHFFDAPVGLLFFLDKTLATGSWVDMGMFIQNVMLAAQAFGLATCPQASLAEYPDIVRQYTKMPETKALLCGMALGYADTAHPINQFRTAREPVDSFTQFIGF